MLLGANNNVTGHVTGHRLLEGIGALSCNDTHNIPFGYDTLHALLLVHDDNRTDIVPFEKTDGVLHGDTWERAYHIAALLLKIQATVMFSSQPDMAPAVCCRIKAAA